MIPLQYPRIALQLKPFLRSAEAESVVPESIRATTTAISSTLRIIAGFLAADSRPSRRR
jgi:hypothetical protein